ncbi:MAG: hypothetical protein AAGI90_06965 [Chlamydiota bacterium]
MTNLTKIASEDPKYDRYFPCTRGEVNEIHTLVKTVYEKTACTLVFEIKRPFEQEELPSQTIFIKSSREGCDRTHIPVHYLSMSKLGSQKSVNGTRALLSFLHKMQAEESKNRLPESKEKLEMPTEESKKRPPEWEKKLEEIQKLLKNIIKWPEEKHNISDPNSLVQCYLFLKGPLYENTVHPEFLAVAYTEQSNTCTQLYLAQLRAQRDTYPKALIGAAEKMIYILATSRYIAKNEIRYIQLNMQPVSVGNLKQSPFGQKIVLTDRDDQALGILADSLHRNHVRQRTYVAIRNEQTVRVMYSDFKPETRERFFSSFRYRHTLSLPRPVSQKNPSKKKKPSLGKNCSDFCIFNLEKKTSAPCENADFIRRTSKYVDPLDDIYNKSTTHFFKHVCGSNSDFFSVSQLKKVGAVGATILFFEHVVRKPVFRIPVTKYNIFHLLRSKIADTKTCKLCLIVEGILRNKGSRKVSYPGACALVALHNCTIIVSPIFLVDYSLSKKTAALEHFLEMAHHAIPVNTKIRHYVQIYGSQKTLCTLLDRGNWSKKVAPEDTKAETLIAGQYLPILMEKEERPAFFPSGETAGPLLEDTIKEGPTVSVKRDTDEDPRIVSECVGVLTRLMPKTKRSFLSNFHHIGCQLPGKKPYFSRSAMKRSRRVRGLSAESLEETKTTQQENLSHFYLFDLPAKIEKKPPDRDLSFYTKEKKRPDRDLSFYNKEKKRPDRDLSFYNKKKNDPIVPPKDSRARKNCWKIFVNILSKGLLFPNDMLMND